MKNGLSILDVTLYLTHNEINKLTETNTAIALTTDEYVIVNVKRDYDKYFKLNNINYPGDTDFIDLYVVYDLKKNYLVIPGISMDYEMLNEVILNKTQFHVEIFKNIESLPVYKDFLDGKIKDNVTMELINRKNKRTFKALLRNISKDKFRINVKDDKGKTVMNLLRDRASLLSD